MIPSGKGGACSIDSDRKARPAAILALLLLSLLWACATLRADLLPNLLANNLLPVLESQVLPLIVLTSAAGLTALGRRAGRPSLRLIWSSVSIGLGLFAAPAVLLYLSDGWIAGPARAALLTLVPVFAVVLEPYISPNSQSRSRGALLAALISLGGSWFVFPVAIPDSLPAAAAFLAVILAAATIAAANCYGVAVAATFKGDRTGQVAIGQLAGIAAIAAATAAAVLALASAVLEQPLWHWHQLAPQLLWSVVVELPALLLLFWLMPRMSAQRMASRYVLAPLLAILVGVIALQSVREVRLRTWLGILCMASGAGWILFAPQEAPDSSVLSLD